VRDQAAVPHRVEIARRRLRGIVAAIGGAEHAYDDAVAAAFDTQRVEGLMEIAHEMDEKLQRRRAVRTVERRVGDPLLVIEDPIDRAVAPAVAAITWLDAWLSRAVAIAVVSRRLRRDVQKMPGGGLLVRFDLLVRPGRDISECLFVEEPRHVLSRQRREVTARDQADQPMSLSAPRLERPCLGADHGDTEGDRHPLLTRVRHVQRIVRPAP